MFPSDLMTVVGEVLSYGVTYTCHECEAEKNHARHGAGPAFLSSCTLVQALHLGTGPL